MKLDINISKYLKYFTLSYIIIGLICFMQGCFSIIVFLASLSAGIDYANDFTILKDFPEFFTKSIVFVVLFCITSLLALSSYHFFSNAGRIVDSIAYLLFSNKNGKWFSKSNIPFDVAIDIHQNPTSKIRFVKQTFVFCLLFSCCFVVSYHLTTVGTANRMTDKLTKTVLITEKQLKNYSDSSKQAINLYYDTQIASVRKTTNYSLEVAEEKQRNIALLLQEKQNALKDLQTSISEIRKEQQNIDSKEAKLFEEKDSKGRVIGGVFEFAVIICSLIIQILNPKEKENVISSPTHNFAPLVETTLNEPFNAFRNETVNEFENVNEPKISQKYADFAKNNKDLTRVLIERIELEKKGQIQNMSFSEIASKFGFTKPEVTNFYYKIREHPHAFKSIASKVVVDSYEENGQIEWQIR